MFILNRFPSSFRVSFVFTLFILFLSVSVTAAYAASYSNNALLFCNYGGGVYGDEVAVEAKLKWSGFNSNSNGKTLSTLWYWNGSGWQAMANGYKDDTGSSGNTYHDIELDPGPSGTYIAAGYHTSTFFSGQQTTWTGQKSCN